METKLVLLGTGTPNACPNASGPASAVVVGDRAYLVDFGPGVVRQASKAYFNGIDALRPDRQVTLPSMEYILFKHVLYDLLNI